MLLKDRLVISAIVGKTSDQCYRRTVSVVISAMVGQCSDQCYGRTE